MPDKYKFLARPLPLFPCARPCWPGDLEHFRLCPPVSPSRLAVSRTTTASHRHGCPLTCPRARCNACAPWPGDGTRGVLPPARFRQSVNGKGETIDPLSIGVLGGLRNSSDHGAFGFSRGANALFCPAPALMRVWHACACALHVLATPLEARARSCCPAKLAARRQPAAPLQQHMMVHASGSACQPTPSDECMAAKRLGRTHRRRLASASVSTTDALVLASRCTAWGASGGVGWGGG